MNIDIVTEPFHYIKIKDLYSNEERKTLMKELLYLNESGAFRGPNETMSAGGNRKRNVGVFLDENKNNSEICRISKKPFNLFTGGYFKDSWFFNRKALNNRSTLVSYYENNDFYKTHGDSSVITALTWFFETPRCFNGGVLSFPEYNIDVDVDNRTTLLFPGNIKHSVSIVKMKDEYIGKNKGRYCMSQFLNVV